MPDIGAFDAKTHFSQILARAAQGEEFTITNRGKPVARLVPVAVTQTVENARAAFARLRSRADGLSKGTFDWAEWKTYRDEGRR